MLSLNMESKLVKSEKFTKSISLIIPCRNENGTIGTAIELGFRLPGVNEVLVIEGNSTDETYQTAINAIQYLGAELKNKVQVCRQSGSGKWDAVLLGIDLSKNEHISIWDADMTVSYAEQSLIHERFLSNLQHLGASCLSTGNRMALREPGSMRFLNFMGNYFFSKLWSILFRKYIPDLLCGSKVFSKKILSNLPPKLIVKDPFGDFAIIAAAMVSGQNLEFQNLSYRARSYGQTNILRWSGGLKLLKFTAAFLNYRISYKSAK